MVKLGAGVAFAIFGVVYGMMSGGRFDVGKTIFEFFYAAEGLLYGYGIMAQGCSNAGGRYVGFDEWGRRQRVPMMWGTIILSIVIGGIMGGILFLLDTGRFIYYSLQERRESEF